MEWLRWILLLVGIALIGAIYWSGRRRERARDETLLQRARRQDTAASPPPDPDLAIDDDLRVEAPAGTFGDLGEFAAPAEPAAPEPPDPGASAETGAGEPAEPEPAAGSESAPPPADEVAPPAAGAAAPATDAHTDAGAPVPEAEPGPEARPRETSSHRAAAASPASDERSGAPAEPPPDERIVVLYVVAADGERLVGERLREAFEQQGLRHGELDVYHGRDGDGRTLFSIANVVEPGTFDPATMGTLTTPGVALFMRFPGPPSAERAFDRMVATARGLADRLEAHVLDEAHSTLTRQTEQHLREEMRALDHRRSRMRR